jgi:hypothetical protein
VDESPALQSFSVYLDIYMEEFVYEDISMNFREATDSLCAKAEHRDLASVLSISVQAIRQARLCPEVPGQRPPPEGREHTVIRLAGERVWYYPKSINRLRQENL